MEFITAFLAGIAFPAPPTLAGWAVWLVLLGALAVAEFRWREFRPMWGSREWGIFFALLTLTLFTSLLILRPFSASARPLPGLPANAPGTALMVLFAIPLLLGGGWLGPLGAAVLGAFAGFLRGAFDSYSVFSILEFAWLGAWFSANLRQPYRTPIYRWLRQPIVSAVLLIPAHLLFYVLIALFTQWGADVNAHPTARLDFALSNTWIVALSFGCEMLIAGLALQIVRLITPNLWTDKKELQPSPSERSIESRFMFAAGSFISLLLLTLLIGNWVVAGRAARALLQDGLATSAEFAAQNVPFFLETGQNLAAQIAANPKMLEAEAGDLQTYLSSQIQSTPYFNQLFVVDAATQQVIASYPPTSAGLTPNEISGSALVLSGVLNQIYSIPSDETNASARVSFVAGVLDATGQARRVLIARTSLNENPISHPLIESLDKQKEVGGAGLLLDENNQVLYHSNQTAPVSAYLGKTSSEALFYDTTASDGTRQLVYYQPVPGRPWAIVLEAPAQRVQQIALNIAFPLFVMIVILALVVLLSLKLALRVVIRSLQKLAVEANSIAQGNLAHPLPAVGEDEIGRLSQAFEQMRASLYSRLQESDRLAKVSQGVASSLEMQDSVKPVLEAIQSIGANSVRVVLSPTILPETFIELPSRFALGSSADLYAHLDQQILALAQSQERLVLPNLSKAPELKLDSTTRQPMALLAVALRRENRYYGVVWAGFERPRNFSEADIRFVTTLAGQAALAVANAHLYLNVEASRRQLEAILNSTPDLVLVTDHRDRLLLANQSAMRTLGINLAKTVGVETTKVLTLKPLVALLQGTIRENQSTEIVLDDQRTYLATASTVLVEGRPTGRVCIMRDVTHFKELDTMKSEFVATVSHDLRSPLTLMRGYATMLETVGQLNEQQQGYVNKIVIGVGNMSRLVNNLLDLGRIEIGVGLQVENVSVLDIIERATSALQLQATQKNITLSVEFSKDMPHAVEADNALLHQAFYNLVENAIKYTPEGGTVNVRTATKQDQLIFEVQDTGIGIPVEDLSRLFEKFYRGKQREARAQHGSGLGLAIVQSIAEKHGGRVWVQSVVGKGSTFYLQIPLVQPGGSKPV
ncbi:MAG: HAMP domain-containing protein [Anaerolineales bacterium]|nr:HAMP domain-containing protein [Anaerolineales bacterium]